MLCLEPESRPTASAIRNSSLLQAYATDHETTHDQLASEDVSTDAEDVVLHVPCTAPDGSPIVMSNTRRALRKKKAAAASAAEMDRFSHPWMRDRGGKADEQAAARAAAAVAAARLGGAGNGRPRQVRPRSRSPRSRHKSRVAAAEQAVAALGLVSTV